MRRGQAAIEFIFLVLIVIVYITTVVIPLSRDAQNVISDVDGVSRANNETQKVVNAINEVSSLGEGSRQTVITFLPIDSAIYCKDKNISFEVKLKQAPYPAQCQNGVCKKTFKIPSTATLDCRAPNISGGKTSVIIEKSADKIIFTKGS